MDDVSVLVAKRLQRLKPLLRQLLALDPILKFILLAKVEKVARLESLDRVVKAKIAVRARFVNWRICDVDEAFGVELSLTIDSKKAALTFASFILLLQYSMLKVLLEHIERFFRYALPVFIYH